MNASCPIVFATPIVGSIYFLVVVVVVSKPKPFSTYQATRTFHNNVTPPSLESPCLVYTDAVIPPSFESALMEYACMWFRKSCEYGLTKMQTWCRISRYSLSSSGDAIEFKSAVMSPDCYSFERGSRYLTCPQKLELQLLRSASISPPKC